jgi:hypothetical protein
MYDLARLHKTGEYQLRKRGEMEKERADVKIRNTGVAY